MPGENDFDMGAAVDSIGSDLGFGSDDTTGSGDDLDLQAGDAAATGAPAPAPASTAAPSPQPPGATGDKTEPAAPAPSPTDQSLTAPGTWRKEAAEQWAAIPPGVQAEILKREQDFHNGLASYKEAATLGNSFKQVTEPYNQLFQQYGVQPAAVVKDLLAAQHTLMLGSPEAKLNLIRDLVRGYGVDISAIGETPYVDPQVSSLQKDVQALQSRLKQDEQQRAENLRAEKVREIEAFAADPKNVHFNDVANDMVQLIQGGLAKTLPEAYEKAVRLNPAVSAKEAQRLQTESEAAARAEAEKKAAQARAAAATNVRTRAKAGGATAPAGSIDDTLTETLAAIKSRG